jgi:hypothetical protein
VSRRAGAALGELLVVGLLAVAVGVHVAARERRVVDVRQPPFVDEHLRVWPSTMIRTGTSAWSNVLGTRSTASAHASFERVLESLAGSARTGTPYRSRRRARGGIASTLGTPPLARTTAIDRRTRHL